MVMKHQGGSREHIVSLDGNGWRGRGGRRSINAMASGGAWSSAVLLDPLTGNGSVPYRSRKLLS